MYESDKIFTNMKELESRIAAIEIVDESSITEYFKCYTELIYNFKNIGSLFDIYSDDTIIHRENGLTIHGPHNLVEQSIVFHSTFPDSHIQFTDTFAIKKEDCYKIWRNYSIYGTCTGLSEYGGQTGKNLGDGNCIVLSMATVKEIDGRWQIIEEYAMTSAELIKSVCTPD